ncbi:MAG: DnaD domain protein [Clostridia bacterium]|nr:DnaD domain protein [Clostridia bacterium]
MKLKLQFGTDAVVLPAALLEHMDKAAKKDLKILLALAAEPLSGVDLAQASAAVASRLSLTQSDVESALAFWRGTGIVVADDAEGEVAPVATTSAPTPRVVADKGLPVYSSTELSEILERRSELSALVDECQKVFGKIFNTSEVAVIAGLLDYLNVDGEYILLLLTHCLRMEKKSLRYVEKMAISLHDEGVHDAAELEERLHRIETMASAVGKIRAMFGISSRALTTKEKAMVEKWVCVMQYDYDVLQKAYEITVDTISKPSLTYANTILERWYAEGYRTLSDVDAAIADYKRQKSKGQGSFDTDDFFEAALKRTYGG